MISTYNNKKAENAEADITTFIFAARYHANKTYQKRIQYFYTS